ncbi:hypothetical protein M8494_03870 [Serratia ureilytica]
MTLPEGRSAARADAGRQRRTGRQLFCRHGDARASSVLIVSQPAAGGLSGELCPGECPPMFAPRRLPTSIWRDGSYGKFEWQVSPSQVMASVNPRMRCGINSGRCLTSP